MKTFKTYEDVIECFLENTPCYKYPYGAGVGLYSKVGDFGGVIEIQYNGIVNVLGFEDCQFKTRVNLPKQAYNLVKSLLGNVVWGMEEDL